MNRVLTGILPYAAGTLFAISMLPQADAQVRFQEVPGVQEFSGQLIAKPHSRTHWEESDLGTAGVESKLQSAREVLEQFSLVEYVVQTDEFVFEVPGDSNENAVSRGLMETGLYEYVHPNWILYPIGCPDDSRFGQQWHHEDNRLQSCDGWDLGTGDPNIVVGICDTGIRTTHEDFLLHRREGYNAVDRIWENNGGDISPVHPHGTMCTGCSAANGNNGVGISGVGWNLGHRMMRVSNSSGGGASLTSLTHGARTSIEAGDKVASVSYSGVDNGSVVSTAAYIKSIGGLMVWAAGNDGRRLTFGDRDSDDLIVAGGTDSSDNRSGFSAFGPFVDVMAPASSVFTTDAGSDSDYASVSGTSFACPLTAGLIALIWSQDPAMTPDQVEQILKDGCDDLGSPGIDDEFAYGRINVFESLSLVRPISFQYPNGLPEFLDPAGGSTVRVEVGAGTGDGVPGTGLMHYNFGTGWNTIPMDQVSNNVYDAVFPGFPGSDCGDTVQYYFSADATDGMSYDDPPSGQAGGFSSEAVASINTVVSLDFELDTGWTVVNENLEDGPWTRGTPVGGGDREDPPSDQDGSGQCWLTDNVDDNSDVDGGPTRLISPVFDLTGIDGDVVVSYARWFGNDDNDADRMVVEASDDGGSTWVEVESVGSTGGWSVHSYAPGDFVSLTNQFRMRFSVSDNPNNSVTEAGLDRFRIEARSCPMALNATPSNLNLGDNFTMTTWKGPSGNPAGLFVTGVNGGPFNFFVLQGTFDAQGDWIVPLVIPNDSAISGVDVTFTAFGIDASGTPVATNTQTISVN